jgi:hypothetical protein
MAGQGALARNAALALRSRCARARARRSVPCGGLIATNGGAQEEDRKNIADVKGNTKSLINAKDMPKPAFAGSQMLRAHYRAMMPEDKFNTPTLESHKYGGKLGAIGSREPFKGTKQKMGANPLEPLGLSTRYGRVDARLSTNDPISFDERFVKLPQI